MKRLFTAVLVTLLSSTIVFSQTDVSKTANWTTFAPKGEEFSVETPILLLTVKYSDENKSNRYYNVLDGTYFFISSDNLKFIDKPNVLPQYKQVLDFVKSSKQTGMNEKVGEYDAEKFDFTNADDFHHKILIVKTKNRIYVFQTTSPSKENPLVGRFFSELKINQVPNSETAVLPEIKNQPIDSIPIEPLKDKEVESPLKDKKIESNIGGGMGSGQGSGSGLGSGRGSGTGDGNDITNNPEIKPNISPNQNNLTTGVRLLSKPRANYTDFARFYQISGKVVLRVTFMADGAIGSVSTISKLPFGLTSQAIAAARGIRFNPAVRNGVPYSVTKTIEYSFRIY